MLCSTAPDDVHSRGAAAVASRKKKDLDHLNYDPIARTGSLDGSYDKSYDIGGKGLSQHASLFGDEGENKAVRRAGARELNGQPLGRKKRCTIQ